MGGWDISCAFCGGPFDQFHPFGGEDDDEGGYDREIVSPQELEWLEDIRVLGFNADAMGAGKCFITGVGHGQQYGSVNCMIGDDPNVTPPKDTPATEINSETMNNFTVYSTDDPDETFAASFHLPCYQIFAQALRYYATGKIISFADLGSIDKDVLHTTMMGNHGSYEHCLKLDYGELSDFVNEQYWGCYPGHEAWVLNPLSNPQIPSFFSNLHNETIRLLTPPSPSTTTLPQRTSPFTPLSSELLCEILLHLPAPSLKSFLLSGLLPTYMHLSHIPAFWKRKLFIDMPFLFDFPLLPLNSSSSVNWFGIYHEMYKHCFATTPETEEYEGVTRVKGRDKSLVLGLANRRRVWETCSELVRLYCKQAKEEGKDIYPHHEGEGEEKECDILRDSISIQLPLVSSPLSRQTKSLRMLFLEGWEMLDKETKFGFYFKGDGDRRLCGIEVSGQGDGNKDKLFGVKEGESVSVTVKAGEWIQGMELNICNADDLGNDALVGITGLKLFFQNEQEIQVGDADGAKRRMMTARGTIITGIVGELGNGIIQRLALLQCTPPFPTSTHHHHTHHPSIMRNLWTPSLPPLPLTATTYATGYWSAARPFDTLPMSYLIFGTTLSELEMLVGISGDEKMTSLGVHFVGGLERRIGFPSEVQDGESQARGSAKEADEKGGEEDTEEEKAQRKMFEIDGPGGERIVKVEVGMNALPHAIKFTTNRNRTFFIGQVQKNNHMIYAPSSEQDGEERFIAGIYASFGRRGSGEKVAACTSISILSAPCDSSSSYSQNLEGEEKIIKGITDNTAFSPRRDLEERNSLEYRPVYLAVVSDEVGEGEESGHW